MPKAELRKDYIQDKYVIIAPRRNKRPHDTKDNQKTPQKISDVFTPAKIDKVKALLTIKDGSSWKIKVVPNKFPVVTLDNPKAYGNQEVVIETPNPTKQLHQQSIKHLELLLKVYAQRTSAISKNKKIQYILIFKNFGGAAGASLQHSHSQIFATDFIPPHLLDKSHKTLEYKLVNGVNAYQDVIAKESASKRLIFKNKQVVAFCPYASQHNYEVWIMPQRMVDNISNLNQTERHAIAKMLKKILTKINQLGLPYNFYCHQIVNDDQQHLYLKITPRRSVWAGVEIGSGVIINPISPESAANFYRSD